MKTGSILDEIRARKEAELDAEKSAEDFESICSRARDCPPRAPFGAALRRAADGTPAVIAELKKASPSAGVIRADFEPRALAESLAGSGAAALSVLTEKNFFLGSPANLEIAAHSVEIPLLRKDFIFDKYQICQAKVWGASAVLLIAAMLGREELAELRAFAESLGLDALCEAHTEAEVGAVVSSGAKIVGINCRDLKSFRTDFDGAANLLGLVPENCLRVCESAVDSRAALLKAGGFGADAALVGTALMRSPSPAGRLAELLGRGA